jgi:hypothetical protein
MERHSLEIKPHENGWAIVVEGITSRVFPSRRLAITEAEKMVTQADPVVWVDDMDGVVRPYAGKSAEQTPRHATPQTEAETPPPAVVMEHIAVPANIHGNDLRDECKEPSDDCA